MKRLTIATLLLLLMATLQGNAHATDRDRSPDRDDMREIRSLVTELDERATALLQIVERNRPKGHRGQDRPYEVVKRFQADVHAFCVSVVQNMKSPDRTVSPYRQMHVSYDRLSDRTEQIQLKPRVGRHLDRIDELVKQIDRKYRRSASQQIDWNRVQYLAHQMDYLSARVYDQARAELTRRSGSHYDWRTKDTLDRLAELKNAADHFHAQVEKGRRNPAHIQADFDRLHDAQQAATQRIWNLEYRTRNDFYRLTDFMNEIDGICYNRRRDSHQVHASSPEHDTRSPGFTINSRPAGSGGTHLENMLSGINFPVFGNLIRF